AVLALERVELGDGVAAQLGAARAGARRRADPRGRRAAPRDRAQAGDPLLRAGPRRRSALLDGRGAPPPPRLIGVAAANRLPLVEGAGILAACSAWEWES